jgi:hypothetical protein
MKHALKLTYHKPGVLTAELHMHIFSNGVFTSYIHRDHTLADDC